MPVINLRLGANHSPTQSSLWKLWMLSQQAEKLLAEAAGWLPDWSWLFPSEIYVTIVSWFFLTIFTSSDRLQMPSRMRTFANHGTQCVFPAPKHLQDLQSPAISQTCTRWKGQRLCKDAQNRQNTAPIWNSRSSIHFFNCEHLELHLECCLALLALHWFNKRNVSMLASPTGINFFGNGSKILCWHSGMTSLQMKVSKGSLWLRTVADCKEQTRCLSSLVILSKESMIMGKVANLAHSTTWATSSQSSLLNLSKKCCSMPLQSARSLQRRPKAYSLQRSWNFIKIWFQLPPIGATFGSSCQDSAVIRVVHRAHHITEGVAFKA